MARSRHASNRHAYLTRQRRRVAPQQPQHHVTLPARAPALSRRQGTRPGRRADGFVVFSWPDIGFS